MREVVGKVVLFVRAFLCAIADSGSLITIEEITDYRITRDDILLAYYIRISRTQNLHSIERVIVDSLIPNANESCFLHRY